MTLAIKLLGLFELICDYPYTSIERVWETLVLKFRSDSYRSSPRAMYNSKMATY